MIVKLNDKPGYTLPVVCVCVGNRLDDSKRTKDFNATKSETLPGWHNASPDFAADVVVQSNDRAEIAELLYYPESHYNYSSNSQIV